MMLDYLHKREKVFSPQESPCRLFILFAILLYEEQLVVYIIWQARCINILKFCCCDLERLFHSLNVKF